MPAAGSPRVPVLLTAESIGSREGGPRCGVWGSSLRYPHCHPLPRPSGTREKGLEVLAPVYLSKGNGGVGGRGPPWSPLAMRTCRSAGRDGRPAGRGGAGQAARGTRGSAAANKGRERLLHVCAAAAGPAGSAVRREGPAAPLLPGLSGRDRGSLRPGIPARPSPWDEAPAGSACGMSMSGPTAQRSPRLVRLLATGHISGAAIYCPGIAARPGLAHKAIHTQQWGFSQQLTRNNIINPFTKPSLFTIN